MERERELETCGERERVRDLCMERELETCGERVRDLWRSERELANLRRESY